MNQIKSFIKKIAPVIALLGALGGLPLVALAFVMYLFWSQEFFGTVGYFFLWGFLGALICLTGFVKNKWSSLVFALVPIMVQVAMISGAIFIALDQLPMPIILAGAWVSAIWAFVAGCCFWYFIRHWGAFITLLKGIFRFRGPGRRTPPTPPITLGPHTP